MSFDINDYDVVPRGSWLVSVGSVPEGYLSVVDFLLREMIDFLVSSSDRHSISATLLGTVDYGWGRHGFVAGHEQISEQWSGAAVEDAHGVGEQDHLEKVVNVVRYGA